MQIWINLSRRQHM